MTPLEQLGDLADVPLQLQAQIDCCPILIEDLLALAPGMILSSERATGEYANVRIGGELVGQGEVIVIENTVALRISDFQEKN
jgi:flagellar motor switch protein FliN/FliY